VALRSVERESKSIDASVLALAHMVWAARQGWMTGDQVTAFVNEPKRASETRSRPSNHAKPDAPAASPVLRSRSSARQARSSPKGNRAGAAHPKPVASI
jgi:hypothetical protein